jgi:transposase InsO family protein
MNLLVNESTRRPGQPLCHVAKNYVVSTAFTAALATTGTQHLKIRAHCPWQNGKVERFNRTVAIE